jgi:hypothetical protein
MDQIKEAFQKVKEDMLNLKKEIFEIHQELEGIQFSILQLIKLDQSKIPSSQLILTDKQTNRQTDNSILQQTDKLINKTQIPPQTDNPTHNPTDKQPFQDLKGQNTLSSTGNEGVPTDKQTNRQTDKQTSFNYKNSQNSNPSNSSLLLPNPSILLNQLDSIKKDIRLKIKRLTNQEMLVFSSIYQFENQNEVVDYTLISTRLNLSESSIRDYAQRIISKGIPLIKEKINNKKIILHISDDFRKLASLETVIKLRDL